jgi:hypothetical protein
MSFDLAGVLADARLLWRRERVLLLPVAGVFFFLPMLAVMLMLASSNFPADVPAEKLGEAVSAFYAAHLLPILLCNLAIDFGGVVVLNLFLQGNGRTLGEVLGISIRRLPVFLGIQIIVGLAFALGASLLLAPGLFAWSRLWLAAAHYAAQPHEGPLEAFRQGWKRSGGWGWAVLLGAGAAVMVASLLLLVVVTGILAGLAAIFDAHVMAVATYLATALVGAFAWTALALVRVAAYRRSAPSSGT